MTTELQTENKKPVSSWKVKALGLLAMGSGLVASASAVAINLTPVTLIIEDVTLLFVPLVAVVIAAVPIENLSSNMASIQNRSPFVFVFGDLDCAGYCRVHLGSV